MNYFLNSVIDDALATMKGLQLRILKGEKHRQIKLQRIQKVRIWAFGSLAH